MPVTLGSKPLSLEWNLKGTKRSAKRVVFIRSKAASRIASD